MEEQQHSVDDFIPDGGVQICEIASSLRDFTSCRVGSYRIGGEVKTSRGPQKGSN